MGYACPVCGTPQSDARHLANHLGFTAVARGGDHEAWLDEHVPGWGDLGEETLAERVVDLAEDADFPQVFEDTTGGHDYAHDDDAATGGRPRDAGDVPVDVAGIDDDLDGDAEEILAEARELTRRRREDSETE